MISTISKTIFVILFTCLLCNLYAQGQENINTSNSNNNITTLDEDSTIYIVKNRKKTLKYIANSLPTPKTLILPYEVYLKEWNNILDENEFLEIGTVIKLAENAVTPKQKQINLPVSQLFPDFHIVTKPNETLKSICREYNFKPIDGFDYYLYVKTWNSTIDDIDENEYLPIGKAIKLTENAILPTEEEITKKTYKIKYVISFEQEYLNRLAVEKENINSQRGRFYAYFDYISSNNKLEILDLENSYWDSLPNNLFKFTQLTELRLGTAKFTKLPPEIEKLNNLTLFYLNDNLLLSLPEQIGKLTKLKGLYVENNNLKNLPKQISYLKELNYFNLQNNKIKLLPKEIGNLENLQSLNISNNLLTKLPKEIENLQKLKRLVLSSNKFTKFSTEISSLTKLKELNISNNPLNKIEINKVLLALPQLEILYLGNLGLQTLPSAVLALRHLTKLDLVNYASDSKKANAFSAKEKQRIKKLLPNVEIIFE
jgi:Leucine-rich repeat (LRR) protein